MMNNTNKERDAIAKRIKAKKDTERTQAENAYLKAVERKKEE